MHSCVMCGKSRDLFELVIPGDEDNGGEDYSHRVCGRCWESIAQIARVVSANQIVDLENRIDALTERLDELENHDVSPYEAAMIVERSKSR